MQNARERARMDRDAGRIANAYGQQGVTQQDLRDPHLSGFGYPGAPLVQWDKRIHVTHSDDAAEGGALSRQQVDHFLNLRINSLRQARESAAERGVTIERGPSTAPTKAAVERLATQTLSVQETLAALARLLESGLASAKLLERSQELLAGVARLAPKLSSDEAAALAAGIEDAAEEAEAQYDELTEQQARSKAGQIKESTAKLLRDTLAVLQSGVAGPEQDRAARVREARKEAAKRPGADSKRRREELARIGAADRARDAAAAAAAEARRAAAEAAVPRARDAAAAAMAAEREDAARIAAARAEAARIAAERAAAAAAPRRRPRREPSAPRASPAVRARREQAQRALEEAEAEAAAAREFVMPDRLPAIATDRYRALVRKANDANFAALRDLARAYHVTLPAGTTQDGALRILLGQH